MSSGHSLTHRSQTMQSLSETLLVSATFERTSISIGHTLVHLLHEVQLSESTGVILNSENREKSPEIVIKGHNSLQ